MASKKKTQKSKEYQTLENLCQQNNINIKNVKVVGADVKSLEMFFGGYPELIGLRFFTRLINLKLIGQDINSLMSLKYISSSLKELWICESKVQKLDGLETCTKITKLYFYNNNIKDCSQISNLHELEVLWLNNNQIYSLQFLESLRMLKEVNLAKNSITDDSMKLVSSWPANITVLNLSMNNINEFKSLVKLTLVKKLISLSFADQMYGQCPITESNYYIPWIFYHFEKLTALDGVEIQNLYIAKKKALKLKLEVDCMLRSIEEKLYEMKARIDKNFLLYHNVVVDQIRNVSQVINFRRSKSNLDYTLPNLEDRKQFWMTSLEKLHKIRFELIDSFQVHMELQQMKLHVCLEACSSETLKDTLVSYIANSSKNFYCPQQMLSIDITDVKVHHCIQLTSIQDLEPGQIFFAVYDKPLTSDFVWSLKTNVHQLDECYFIQNFFILAHKFLKEDRGTHFCNLIAVKVADTCRKTKLIYNIKDGEPDIKKPGKNEKSLITKCECSDKKIYHRVEHVRITGDYELLALVIIEFVNEKFSCFSADTFLDGVFPQSLTEEVENDKSLATKSDNFIILTNLTTETLSADSNLTVLNLSYNTIEDISLLDSLTKLTLLDMSYNKIQSLTSLKNLKKLEELNVEGNCLKNWFDEMNHLKFFCSKLNILNFRFNLWSLDDEKLAEVFAKSFFINLTQCNTKNIETVECSLTLDELGDKKFISRIWDIQELPLLLNSEDWINLFKRFGWSPINEELLTGNRWCSKVTGLNVEGLNLMSLQKLEELPKLKFLTLNKTPIIDITSLSSLSQLEILHLDYCCIEKLPNLRLLNLSELSLRFNNLNDMSFCKHVPQLKKLDLTGNNIVSLDDVHFLTQLKEIILARNHIAYVRDIKTLKTIPTLLVIDLTGNEVQQVQSYRSYAIHLFKSIEVLDHSLVCEEERKHCEETFGHTLNLDFLASKYNSSELGRMIHLSLPQLGLNTASLPSDNNLSHILSLDLTENKFKYIGDIVNIKNLERLVLSLNCFVKVFQSDETLEDVKYLPKLKALHLDQNNISKLQNLQLSYLPTLTELYLQNNKIVHVQGLSSLVNLEVLDLSYNKISVLSSHSFEKQNKLKYLSMAYNRLKELTHLSKLEHLEHLDISFNSVQSLQSIKNMESLKNLQTFKCTGNPVCKRNVYQHVIVSHFPNLQSIDEKVLSLDDREISKTTMEANKKPVIKTTNLGKGFGDEEEEEKTVTVLSTSGSTDMKKSLTLPVLYKNTISLSINSNTPNKLQRLTVHDNRQTRRIEALNLSPVHSQVSLFTLANGKRSFQIFGRPCSIERKIHKKKI